MDTFEQNLSQICAILKKYGVLRASLFGSFSKGKQTKNSDIDLLIETNGAFTLFDMLKLEEDLKQLTNRNIDLVEFSAIKKSIKHEVLQMAIPIL